MKFQSLLLSAALGLTVAGAQAGELYTPTQYEAPSAAAAPTLTRAQAKQEVQRARARGDFDHNDFAVPASADTPFGRTRADVKGEVLAARRTGDLEHDDVDLPAIAKGSVLTRQEVKQEAIAARQASRRAPGRNTIDY
jgi:hypothetical protein